MSKYELYTVQLITTCSNCYILVDTPSRAAAVIDPGCNPDKIMEAIKVANAVVKLIIDMVIGIISAPMSRFSSRLVQRF